MQSENAWAPHVPRMRPPWASLRRGPSGVGGSGGSGNGGNGAPDGRREDPGAMPARRVIWRSVPVHARDSKR